MLSLENWNQALDILPLEEFQYQAIFEHMLLACKISKFWEINFKILAQILAMPKIIVKVKGADNL